MFTVPPHGPGPPYRAGRGVLAPHYEHLPIHFAANYTEMLLLPALWVREFEQLLTKLFWSNAVVYNEFTGIRYRWEPAGEFRCDPTHPRKFTLTCCGFKEVNLTHAQAEASLQVGAAGRRPSERGLQPAACKEGTLRTPVRGCSRISAG